MRDWLKIIREKNDMSKTDVAKIVGISANMYHYIENGERCPSVETAQAIAEALNFDWQLFFPKRENTS